MALRRFIDELPAQCQNDPDVQFLSEQARGKVATIVQLKYQSNKFETAGKMFEFSRRAMEEHWQAGYDDTKIALGEPAVFELPACDRGRAHIRRASRLDGLRSVWPSRGGCG